MKEFQVSFPMTGRKTKSSKKDGEYDIIDIANRIRLTMKRHPEIPPEYLLYRICRNLIFVDRKNQTHYLENLWYCPWNIGSISFIAARVIQTEQFLKNTYHVLCEYYGGKGLVRGYFIVSETEYNHRKESCENGSCEYIVGTCIRKQYQVKKRSKYHIYTHSYVKQGLEIRNKTKMLDFCLFTL